MDALRIGQLLILKMIFIHPPPGAQACTLRVTQNGHQEARESDHVTLSCSYQSEGCPVTQVLYWFRYLSSNHEILSPEGKDSRFKVTKNDRNSTLEIQGLKPEDSGIYICAVASGEKMEAAEATLVVRDQNYRIMTGDNVALAVICALLSVYCAAVLSYYAYRTKWKICTRDQKKEAAKKPTTNFQSRRIFQAMAQEYQKRYGKPQKQDQVIDDDRIYQNTTYTH